MLSYKNLVVIGTSHIAIESVREVGEALRRLKPEVVALELDKTRFMALTNKKPRYGVADIKAVGLRGFILNAIGSYIERKLGEIVKVKPGSEMRKAIDISKETGSRIALIDQNISVTLKRLSSEITWQEKLRFVWDILKGIFKRQTISFDLRKVPPKRVVKELTNSLKEKYPSAYKVLLEERNKFMAKNLHLLMKSSKSIVAVVGVGHEEGILDLLKKIDAAKDEVQ